MNSFKSVAYIIMKQHHNMALNLLYFNILWAIKRLSEKTHEFYK
jgi:hypothetical protein